MQDINQFINDNKDRLLNELLDLLRIPSVSADPAYSHDVFSTADAIKTALEKAGCDAVEICETQGFPIVYGEKNY